MPNFLRRFLVSRDPKVVGFLDGEFKKLMLYRIRSSVIPYGDYRLIFSRKPDSGFLDFSQIKIDMSSRGFDLAQPEIVLLSVVLGGKRQSVGANKQIEIVTAAMNRFFLFGLCGDGRLKLKEGNPFDKITSGYRVAFAKQIS